jgi:hypothetical protein
MTIEDNDFIENSEIVQLYSRLLDLGESDLMALLGEQVSAGAGGLDKTTREGIGRAWWSQNLDPIRAQICADSRLKQIRTGKGSDGLILLAAIADAISPLLRGPSLFTASALATQYGLRRMCDE